MKAVVYEKYGPPEVMQLREVAKPAPKDNEVLIKIRAASVNEWDWGLLKGIPFMNRLVVSGPFKPGIKILGSDIAGLVEAVGNNVVRFQPGEEVFGDISACGFGGFAEYVAVSERALVPKPPAMTFKEAAATPQAAVLALQGLYGKGQIQSGQKVLINGGGGGAGTFAIQIAKSFGAEVTGVDSTRKLEAMSTIGADHVIDYTKEDFTENGLHYERIIDFAAHHSIFDYQRALSHQGRYVMVGGATSRIIQVAILGPLVSKTTNKKMGLVMHKQNKDMALIIDLFAAGKVKPVIDRCYPLNEVPQAMRYFGQGQARGKVVITVQHDNRA